MWLDLENTYGSVRHQLLEKAMDFFWTLKTSYQCTLNVLMWGFLIMNIQLTGKSSILAPWWVVISPLVFVLVVEILRSADVNTNQITGPSMKAFMDDVTLIAESRSHMEQLVTHLQALFKWAAMKIKPSKCRSLLLKGNCKEIVFCWWKWNPHNLRKSVKSRSLLLPTTY